MVTWATAIPKERERKEEKKEVERNQNVHLEKEI